MKKQILILLAISLIIGTCKAQTNNNSLLGSSINYNTGTAVLTAINAALTTLSIPGVSPKLQTEYTEGAALVTGVVQLGYGIYRSGSNLSATNIVNITLGSATIITNAILLYNTINSGNKKATTKKKTSWNIYYSPIKNNNPDYGIRLVKYFKI